MTLTNLIKNSMKYPLTDKKKLLTLGIIVTITGIISTIINYIILSTAYHINYEELAASTNITTVQELTNIIQTQIPTNTWIIIGILTLIYFIISIYIFGYQLNVMKNATEENYIIPEFNKPIEKIINGLKGIMVYIAYLIIPTIIISTASIIGGTIGTILLVIGSILLIYASLISLMAIVHMAANNNKINYAFQFKEINTIIKDISWIRYIGTIIILALIFLIISLAAELIISIISSGLAVLTHQFIIAIIIQTIIISLIIEPYIELFLNYGVGSLYNETISKQYDVDEEYII